MLNDRHHGRLDVGHTVLQTCQRTSPSYALLLDNRPSYHCCSHILYELVFLLAESLP
jgi:hypothetical protein